MQKRAQEYNAAHPAPPVEERFWEKVDHAGGPNACWPWIGKARHKFGYGLFFVDRQNGLARSLIKASHRVAYELTYGPIPPGKNVLHDCDNPPCCNPKHLSLGTQLENMAGAADRGRTARGEKHSRAKLTEQEVLQIRAMDGRLSPADIAGKFEVST